MCCPSGFVFNFGLRLDLVRVVAGFVAVFGTIKKAVICYQVTAFVRSGAVQCYKVIPSTLFFSASTVSASSVNASSLSGKPDALDGAELVTVSCVIALHVSLRALIVSDSIFSRLSVSVPR